MAELGFFSCMIPEKYGGSNAGYLSHALVVEVMGKVSGSLRIPFNTIAFGPAATLNLCGNEEGAEEAVSSRIDEGRKSGLLCHYRAQRRF
jgi:alkylation response protein AidB-like acyl-CoA dehydrogenase